MNHRSLIGATLARQCLADMDRSIFGWNKEFKGNSRQPQATLSVSPDQDKRHLPLWMNERWWWWLRTVRGEYELVQTESTLYHCQLVVSQVQYFPMPASTWLPPSKTKSSFLRCGVNERWRWVRCVVIVCGEVCGDSGASIERLWGVSKRRQGATLRRLVIEAAAKTNLSNLPWPWDPPHTRPPPHQRSGRHLFCGHLGEAC